MRFVICNPSYACSTLVLGGFGCDAYVTTYMSHETTHPATCKMDYKEFLKEFADAIAYVDRHPNFYDSHKFKDYGSVVCCTQITKGLSGNQTYPEQWLQKMGCFWEGPRVSKKKNEHTYTKLWVATVSDIFEILRKEKFYA